VFLDRRICSAALAVALTALTWTAPPAAHGHPLAGPATALAALRADGAHVMGLHRWRAGSKQQSLNWSGYIRTGRSFTRASASWHVPSLKTTYDGYSSTWVGIDGATSTDGYLVQTGTEADVSGGRRSYRAWWEVITPSDPAPETVFANLTVRPGDSISAAVYRVSSGRWTMRLRDNTTGHSASHTADFAGPGSSAEWIQEDTDVNGYISAAPDWETVTFRYLRLNGANPDLVASEAVDIVDSAGTREDVTSAPTSSGSGFTVTWLAHGTRTAAG
jgi:Peptidase A4 family